MSPADASLAPTSAESQPLHTFAEKAYLDYSMYVVLDRALPHLADGLKPVQRRIIYAMSELGLSAGSKHKKSARTVGDVIGKYHPHGDSACYEAMVTMAQPFSYRQPLVDGQGNWGSADDPKSFAAMRYTESRLMPYAQVLLAELAQGTAEWLPNFDGTMDEPRLLPARVPNILINGAMGIAVGMATDIPPHNLGEVCRAAVHLLEHPEATIAELMAFVPAPDYPTGCEIVSEPGELRRIYETGNGQIRARARFEREEDGNIVVTALPHQVSPARVLEQIAEQMRAKKLPLIEDLRDESDHETPVRVVIIPRSNRVDTEALMGHLFATTDLEKSFRANMNMIGLDGRPRVKTLKEILAEWLVYRRDTVRKRITFRLEKVEARLHLLAGYLVAYLNVDEVIRIVRTEDEPKPVLMQTFELSAIQAEAILDLKLRHLQKLEEMQIRKEQAGLEKEAAKLGKLLKSEGTLKKLIAEEILADAEKFSDARRCPLNARAPATAREMIEVTPAEPLTVVLSKAGWIRAAKGHGVDAASLSYKANDQLLTAVEGKSTQALVLFDDRGRSYSLNPRELPSARGQGEPVSGKLDLQDGGRIAQAMLADLAEAVVVGGNDGYAFLTRVEDLVARNKAGKAVLTLGDGATVLPLLRAANHISDRLVLATAEGRLLHFPLGNLPELTKGRGNKAVALKGADRVTAWCVLPEGTPLELASGARTMTVKPSDLATYAGERGGRGRELPQGFRRVDRLQAKTI